jgi:PAS domain S-box-containing protein
MPEHSTSPNVPDAAARSLLAAIVESSDDAIVSKDLNGVVTSWNRGAERIFGYTAEEMIGQPILRLIPPEWPDEEPRILARIRAGKRIDHYDTVRMHKDGTRINVSVTISPIRDAAGEIVGASKVARDVTLQKRFSTDQAILAAIVESSDDAIVSKDLNGVVTSWNRGAERIFGYTAEEMIGQPILRLIPPEWPDEEPKILGRIIRGERIDHYDTVRLRKDGTRIQVSVTISPIRDASGTIVGASKVARDISQQREVELELQRRAQQIQEQNEQLELQNEELISTNEELQAADRQKNEFLTMLAHELRNPLGPIVNAVTLMAKHATQDEALRRNHDLIARQVRHMARLVDDLLDVSRVTRGLIVLRKEDLDLRSAVSSAVATMEDYVNERQHHLTVDLPPFPVVVHGDTTRLQQIVTNLLSNAAKFTDPGGNITVTVGTEAEDAVLSVRDTGPGISPKMLTRVFDLFAQEDQSLAREKGGLGVGLTVVKNLVQMHDGSIEARSEGLGTGAEFIIRLRLTDATIGARSSPPVAEGPDMDLGGCVFVVDDSRDAATSLAELAESWGYEAHPFTSGAAALEALPRLCPEVVVLDIGMPHMDGYELARRLREHGFAGRIIALTGYVQEHDRRKATDCGFDYHLSKPAEPDKLRALLADVRRAS